MYVEKDDNCLRPLETTHARGSSVYFRYMTARRKLLAVVSIIIGVTFIFFFHWTAEFDIGMKLNTGRRREVKGEMPDEFENCETIEGQSATAAAVVLGGVDSKRPAQWCMYKDEVALRIIVLTFNRPASLQKLLDTINDLELDGDSAAVDIWIDRDRKKNTVDNQTVSTARNFRWRHGPVNVHVRNRHVGLYGQWIDTWRPRSASSSEMALILEDDLSLSPFAYRWLRAARRFYVDRRDDISGMTLQSEGLFVAAVLDNLLHDLVRPSADGGAAFLYAAMNPWGYAPTPASWIEFQDWFYEIRSKPDFHPYIPGTIMTMWYKVYERMNTTESKWSTWYHYYCAKVRQLYTVYNNIPVVAKQLGLQTDDKHGCLSVNRREPGLHFFYRGPNNTHLLLTTWNDNFIVFREDVPVLNLEGKNIKEGPWTTSGAPTTAKMRNSTK